MKDGGFALVSVLWIVVLLALATVAVIGQARRVVDGAATVEEVARARALADAGVMRAVYDLMAADAGTPDNTWPVDGASHRLDLPGGSVAVVLHDEGGLVDLNDADEALLAGLFRQAGAERPEDLAAAVADWRDEDQLKRIGGAEADDYRRAGLAWRPRDGAFESVDELRLVMGMTPELFGRVRDQLTVWGHRPDVDFDTAPRQVLMALADMDPARADTILSLRPARPALSAARTIGIRAVGRTTAGAVFVREAAVHLTREPKRPIEMLAWRQGEGP